MGEGRGNEGLVARGVRSRGRRASEDGPSPSSARGRGGKELKRGAGGAI
jgi:hypothetical protein